MKTIEIDKVVNIKIGKQIVDVSFRGVHRLSMLITNAIRKKLNPFVKISGLMLNLDLTGIDFIDSEGFSTLLAIMNTSKQYGVKLTLSNINNEVDELISVVKLNRIFSDVSQLVEVQNDHN